ncbi:MAG: RDD family protein [Cytophagaceae bacterium]|nr:RDD family protein [Cytophagaceae bacterium]MBK9509106.1 RDD family protein [Cytophagaceae bacterium]MBK9933897.1 RDD family protein [Cytophagaceae bacterium]MBL0302388.1 RDD family protein [Cytophagaceae bacterium]MBL0325212.1 RDD family protein [Cytophagaceae bacterium]
METIFIENSQPRLVLASKEKRLINFLVDYLVSIFLAGLLSLILNLILDFSGIFMEYSFLENDAIFVLFFYFFWPFYYIVSESLFGKTIGKSITKTKVVDFNGEKPAFWRILIRSFSRFLPYEPLTFFSQKRFGWHDKVSRTKVVNE